MCKVWTDIHQPSHPPSALPQKWDLFSASFKPVLSAVAFLKAVLLLQPEKITKVFPNTGNHYSLKASPISLWVHGPAPPPLQLPSPRAGEPQPRLSSAWTAFQMLLCSLSSQPCTWRRLSLWKPKERMLCNCNKHIYGAIISYVSGSPLGQWVSFLPPCRHWKTDVNRH